MSFIPRARFAFPSTAPTWYIGHMHRAVRKIRETLSHIDLVLEIRDARLPISTINPAFEKLFGSDRGLLPKNGKKRIILYNKRDLAEPGLERPIQRALLENSGQLAMFSDTRSDHDVRRVLRTAIKIGEVDMHRPVAEGEDGPGLRILIAGMPNVGKSSMINALRRVGVRKGKAARVSPEAGMTRKVTGTVRVWDDPITYVYDTPGLMIPYFGAGDEAVERAMKLALVSGLKETLYDPVQLSDYLLYRLNLRYFNPDYPTPPKDLPAYLQPFLEVLPTNDIGPLLQAIGTRIGALRKGGIIDEDFAARSFIRAFREGKLGLWALDDMGLLIRGDEDQPRLPAPAAVFPVALPYTRPQPLLSPPEMEESLALITAGSSLPAVIAEDSPTYMQISTFMAHHFELQRIEATQLSNSKNQIKKRERAEDAEKRKEKWIRKHPRLAIGGRGESKRTLRGRTFFVGGNRMKRKVEKGRYLARKVARKRKKMR